MNMYNVPLAGGVHDGAAQVGAVPGGPVPGHAQRRGLAHGRRVARRGGRRALHHVAEGTPLSSPLLGLVYGHAHLVDLGRKHTILDNIISVAIYVWGEICFQFLWMCFLL